jgi:hypothetical protein
VAASNLKRSTIQNLLKKEATHPLPGNPSARMIDSSQLHGVSPINLSPHGGQFTQLSHSTSKPTSAQLSRLEERKILSRSQHNSETQRKFMIRKEKVQKQAEKSKACMEALKVKEAQELRKRKGTIRTYSKSEKPKLKPHFKIRTNM